MGWEWNTYGPPELHGWVWVDGKWSWGAVHMWHLVDFTYLLQKQPWGAYVPPALRDYDWVCTDWWWRERWRRWDLQELHTVEDTNPEGVEAWMLHKLQ